jgi:hypothetical protein
VLVVVAVTSLGIVSQTMIASILLSHTKKNVMHIFS